MCRQRLARTCSQADSYLPGTLRISESAGGRAYVLNRESFWDEIFFVCNQCLYLISVPPTFFFVKLSSLNWWLPVNFSCDMFHQIGPEFSQRKGFSFWQTLYPRNVRYMMKKLYPRTCIPYGTRTHFRRLRRTATNLPTYLIHFKRTFDVDIRTPLKIT